MSVASHRASHLTSSLDVAVRVLDALRRRAYRLCVPWLAPLVADRDRRVLYFGAVGLGVSAAAALLSPLYLLALGPILLGVPHILSDVRYLLVKPGHHRSWRLWIVVAPLVAWAGTGGGVVVGLSATALAFAVSPGRLIVRACGTVACSVLAFAASRWGFVADVVFAHLHNFVAIVWLVLLARSWQAAIVALLFVAACFGVAMVPVTWLVSLPGPSGQTLLGHAGVLAPGLPAQQAVTLVVLFAFAQSAHYAVWLRLVPEVQRERPAPRSFRASWVALRRDFGAASLAVSCAVAVALLAVAAFDLVMARDRYLRLALFHGHMELALFAVWLVRGRRGEPPQ